MQTTKQRPRRGGGAVSDNRNRRSSGRRPFHSGRSNRRGPARSGRNRQQGTFDPTQFINVNPVTEKEEVYTPSHTFAEMQLDKRLLDNLAKNSITTPSPIQDKVIPQILDGNDVIGIAETGTGKTAAFLLPLIHKTLKDPKRQTLIVTPTRELAIQIERELRLFGAGLKLFSTTCVGGTNLRPQIMGLKKKNHFIIGTPGRLIDLIDRGNLRPQYISTVVLDEADRMLDMGFIQPIKQILENIPKEREMLFFSATMDKRTEALTEDFMQSPITVSVKKKDVTNAIKQNVISFVPDQKFDTLFNLLKKDDMKRVIIFGAMKHSVEKLANQLSTEGITAESIHGNKTHSQRQQALRKFKSGNARVLVATDVAARGIHVDDVSHVINYDLPNTFEDYVHRIGRTGRGDKRGEALTFVTKR